MVFTHISYRGLTADSDFLDSFMMEYHGGGKGAI